MLTPNRILGWLAILLLCSVPALAVQFTLTSVNGNVWTYTLTFAPEDNYCIDQPSPCTATITLNGLYGVVAATGSSSTDFPAGSLADTENRHWTASVQNGGTTVVWSNVDGSTGNYNSIQHAFGFSITANGAATGLAPVLTSQFCLDDGPPCTDLDIDTTVAGPVNATAGSAQGSMPQTVSGGGWDTLFTLVNNAGIPATALLNMSANNGGALTLPIDNMLSPVSSVATTINPGGTVMINASDQGQPKSEGWTSLLASGAVGGFAIFKYPAFNWEAVVPLETRNASNYILAFDDTGALTTGVAIANLTQSPASVPVFINDDQGNRIGLGTVMLQPLGHTSFMLPDLFPVTAGVRGTVEFDTPPITFPNNPQISVLGLRVNGPALTTLPVLAQVDPNGGNLTHILFNGGFTNNFTLVNTGSSTASATLNFYGNSGAPLSVPLSLPQTGENLTVTTLTRSLAPGASLLIQTVGDDSATSVEGSAQLITTGNIGGFGIFRWTQYQQEASVPIETRNANAYVLAFDDTNGINTGIALANVSGQSATIPVVIRDDSGAILFNSSIMLNAHGHTSFMLPTRYASAVGRRGTIEFDTPQSGRISVIGLRATGAGTLTTIPILSK